MQGGGVKNQILPMYCGVPAGGRTDNQLLRESHPLGTLHRTAPSSGDSDEGKIMRIGDNDGVPLCGTPYFHNRRNKEYV